MLLREPLGEAPAPDSPEATQRARDLALREQKSRVDLLRERMHDVPAANRAEAYAEHYAELIEYQHQLEAAKTWHDPGITHEFIEAEHDEARECGGAAARDRDDDDEENEEEVTDDNIRPNRSGAGWRAVIRLSRALEPPLSVEDTEKLPAIDFFFLDLVHYLVALAPVRDDTAGVITCRSCSTRFLPVRPDYRAPNRRGEK